MNSTNILILTLKTKPFNDEEYTKVVSYCVEQENACVEEMTIENEDQTIEIISHLSDNTAIILWCHDKSDTSLLELRSMISISKQIESNKSLHAGCIIILDQSAIQENDYNVNVKKIKEGLLGKNYVLGRPISRFLLEMHINSFVAKIKDKQLLNRFKSQLLDQQNLDDILGFTLATLQDHPSIGYHRATISLVTTREEGMERYLLKHDDVKTPSASKTVRRDLQKPIVGDKLMTNVCNNTSFIISDIHNKLKNTEGRAFLEEFGWDEKDYSTKEVNSWIGLAAKREGETIAVFTLDSDKPDKYSYKDESLTEYLESFGHAFADRIYSHFVKRNKNMVQKIMANIGEKLNYLNLIDTILVNLHEEFKCEECSYFEISNEVQNEFADYDVRKSHRYPRKLRVVPASGVPMNGECGTLFKQGKGIIGKVWYDKKARIVANAQEDKEFIQSRALESFDLSMLVVPVLATSKPNEERIIGIICCHQQNSADFFTVYDRKLVQNVAVATANIIERTRILESISEIALETADMVVDDQKLKFLLQKICQSAYALTSVNSASIHFLEGSSDESYRKSLKPNFSYPMNHEAAPRLDGSGVTDCVITEKCTKIFSKRLDNYDRINIRYRDKEIQCKLVVPLMVQDGSVDNGCNSSKKLLGCLYLDKYQEDSFSDVEIFTLELLARHAAISLNKNLLVAEKTISIKALEGLKYAIESIAGLEKLDSLLQEVARNAYDLCDVPVTLNKPLDSNSSMQLSIRTPIWPDLIAYVAEYNEQKQVLKVKAAYPPQYLGKLNDAFIEAKKQEKLGVSGLAIGRGGAPAQTYNIPDIQCEKDKDSDLFKHYITINPRTSSQLSVPILRRSSVEDIPKELGVITLEHTTAHAFSKHIENVIEQFAQHVAIAYEQQISTDKIKSETQILTSLHKSLEVIVKEPSQSMLYKAVTQTREALLAKSVYVVPLQAVKPDKMNILWDRSEPFVDEVVKRSTFKITSSEDVSHPKELTFEEVSNQVFFNKEDRQVSSDSECGYCFLFSSGEKCIGVIWILHDISSNLSQRSFDVNVIKSYVNQIALAYANSTQYNELKRKSQDDLDKQLSQDNSSVRRQSNIYFILACCASGAGIIMLVVGISTLFFGKEDSRMKLGVITAGIGLVLEASTILVFRQLEAANRRLDQYHSERLSIGQLNTLLSASEQITQVDSLKTNLIEGAKSKWLAN